MTSVSQFPHLAMGNRKLVERSATAGCFHCAKAFPAQDVTAYTDGGRTVLCPRCGVDSVVADGCGFPVTEAVLETARQFWYGAQQTNSAPAPG